MSKRSFLREFFKANKMVGSILPSSRFLSKKMLRPIQFDSAAVIVEFGPGTGVFTKALLSQMGPKCQLVVIELNDAFYQRLKRQFHDPRLHLIHGSASDLGNILKQLQLGKADYILSSLPLTNFPQELRNAILTEAKTQLSMKGLYIQFQYSRGLKSLYAQHFKHVSLDYTALNVPPAYIYTCSNS
ncbi:MAG: rRNA ((1402)-N(4))-methyltransferase [Bacteroidota bacterium]|jgi:phospholipid N-methyltransferase